MTAPRRLLPPGPELDAFVAAFMELAPDQWVPVCIADNHSTDEDIWCCDCGRLVSESELVPPHYSRDIGAAWRVVERLRELRKGERELRAVFSLAYCYSARNVAEAICRVVESL